jgi:hypothetical protein
MGGGRWTLRLTTDAAGYGGEGRLTDESGQPAEAALATADAWSGDGSSLGETAPADAPRRLTETLADSVPGRQTVSLPPWSAAVFVKGLGARG